MRMEPVVEDLPGEFDALQAEARAEGHQFLDRLANEWASGAMRFQQPGEQLLAVYSKNTLAGVGGITVDPDIPDALRMRRFYVRPRFRRTGIARSMARALMDRAFQVTNQITLNAAPNSVLFWESLGFIPDPGHRRTHALHKAGTKHVPF